MTTPDTATRNPLSTPLPAQAKAVLAGVIAGLAALLPTMPDGFQWSDLVIAVLAALTGYGAVFNVPNADPPLTHNPGDPDPAPGGEPADGTVRVIEPGDGYHGKHVTE